MNDISVSLATSSCSGAVIFVVIEPTIVPLRTSLISSIARLTPFSVVFP